MCLPHRILLSNNPNTIYQKSDQQKLIFTVPDFSFELSIGGYIAGIDEAGRGPWAGPVYAAAVILNKKINKKKLRDSKKLTKKRREILYRGWRS